MRPTLIRQQCFIELSEQQQHMADDYSAGMFVSWYLLHGFDVDMIFHNRYRMALHLNQQSETTSVL